MKLWKEAAGLGCKMEGVRWAFGCGPWRPRCSEWLLAARCVQDEERERIGRFIFAKDAKAAMSGRLMIRKLIAEKMKIPWNEIQLKRTIKGKPFLANPVLNIIPNLNFNISHQGDYTVLAAEPILQVGVDIMKTDFPGSTSVAEFFRIMKRQFTDHEWNTIHTAGDEWEKLDIFYRYWETMLDDRHHVAVALGKQDTIGKYPGEVQENINEEPSQFILLTYQDLTSSAITMAPEDPMYWRNFEAKEEKPSRQRKMPV
ncbi:L-aminoadipate-semialdehyde dehydrogenase-phosphopantetheinyl transferase isoform X2 [Leucoraja erinacea]|uniref:L-aminoadipate-semialdehyde dehydrogenase-phosphopantetheinyl transferase isoform X2 n=1 Tax=Leucoraja erinaceus TaxID=7782 RepID=UPI0024562F32|nr:L-aminoadipate-semialdehyde dehydrogenase-phosphopantetheinyl transferase isoform X2 [Leucoraja erinacea]